MGMEQELFDFILIIEDWLKAVQVRKLVLSPIIIFLLLIFTPLANKPFYVLIKKVFFYSRNFTA